MKNFTTTIHQGELADIAKDDHKQKMESERGRTQKILPYISFAGGTIAVLLFVSLIIYLLNNFTSMAR